MTREEIKINLEQIIEQISKLEQSESQLYTDLGRKVLPDLPDDAYPELVAEIKLIENNLIGRRYEQNSLEKQYQQIIIAATCFYCKAVNADGSAFCEECGKRLGEKPKEYCEACGTMNHPGQKFCGECGTKLPE